MEQERLQELISLFRLKNDLTENPNIWIGHAKIGFRKSPNIEEAKSILLGYFKEFIEEFEPTPQELKKTLSQWEDYHPFQKVREIDQPMFISRNGNKIIVAVIWPWQIKEGTASLMIYNGEILE